MKKNKKKSTAQDGTKKKKITFPKVMLILAIATAVGLGAYFIIDKLNDSVVKSVNIEGAFSEIYIGNPQYESVEFDVSVYPDTANQGFTVFTSDANIASVSITEEGKVKVTAVSIGEATITVQSTANSSLKDTCVVRVKNTDVQNVTFIEKAIEEEEEDKVITSAVMQKDGLEHYVYFSLKPSDANMDNLSVSYDEKILESVTIDKEHRRLVVIPKTDIEDASTTVYVEINQDTDEGERVVSKNIRVQINLVEREAYLAFEFASEANNKQFSSNHSGFVYLDPKNEGDSIDKRDISDFLVKVNMAYDKDFKNLGEFKMEDFIVKVNDQIIINHDSTEDTYYYTKKALAPTEDGGTEEVDITILEIKKINDNGQLYYKVTASTAFEEEKYCRLTFEHFYTKAQGVVEVSWFKQDDLTEESKNQFNISVGSSKLGQTINMIDKGVYSISKGSEAVVFTTYDKAISAGIIKAFPLNSDNEECYTFSNGYGEEILITQATDRMKLSASSNVFNTQNTNSPIKISLKYKSIYWDNRYAANYGEEQKIDLVFYVEGVYFTVATNESVDNVNQIQWVKGSTTKISIYSTLDSALKGNNASNTAYQNYFNANDVSLIVYKSTTSGLEETDEIISTTTTNGGLWEFVIDTNKQTSPANGTKYVMVFSYCDMQIVINATLTQ